MVNRIFQQWPALTILLLGLTMASYQLRLDLSQAAVELSPQVADFPQGKAVTNETEGVSHHLFLMGQVVDTAKKSAIEQKVLPNTRLQFVLKGLFVNPEGDLGGAVIHTGKREPGFYRVGDVIVDNIVLAAIREDGAVLDRGGKRELLAYDRTLMSVTLFEREQDMSVVERYQRLSVMPAGSSALSTVKNSGAVNDQNDTALPARSLADRLAELQKRINKGAK